MSERKIESRLVLAAYQRVVTDGVRDGDAWRLDGLTAQGDFDGYTVSLTDGVVRVQALFHNQVAIDAPNGKALENFVRRLHKVVEADRKR